MIMKNKERKPDDKNLDEFIKLYDVSSKALKDYDFIDPVDTIYIKMWFEEEFPYTENNLDYSNCKFTPYNMNVINGLNEWAKMREKLDNGEISCEEYIDWKLNFKLQN